MQESVFKKELNKYRVVRREDSCKIRWKKIKETPAVNSNVSKKNKKMKHTVSGSDPNTSSKDTAFWKDIESYATTAGFSSDETQRFLTQLRQV